MKHLNLDRLSTYKKLSLITNYKVGGVDGDYNKILLKFWDYRFSNKFA